MKIINLYKHWCLSLLLINAVACGSEGVDEALFSREKVGKEFEKLTKGTKNLVTSAEAAQPTVTQKTEDRKRETQAGAGETKGEGETYKQDLQHLKEEWVSASAVLRMIENGIVGGGNPDGPLKYFFSIVKSVVNKRREAKKEVSKLVEALSNDIFKERQDLRLKLHEYLDSDSYERQLENKRIGRS